MSCLKCMKFTMCLVNFIFFICGAVIFAFGIYLHTTSQFLPTLSVVNVASALFIIGIFVTCVSFLGFLGALKENRCLLITFFILLFVLMLSELAVACALFFYEEKINSFIETELTASLKQSLPAKRDNGAWDTIQQKFHCCGVQGYSDWNGTIPDSCCSSPPCNSTTSWTGCYTVMKDSLDNNLLSTGIGIISICIVEVLSMCFSMTLFCHISKSGLGYK